MWPFTNKVLAKNGSFGEVCYQEAYTIGIGSPCLVTASFSNCLCLRCKSNFTTSLCINDLFGSVKERTAEERSAELQFHLVIVSLNVADPNCLFLYAFSLSSCLSSEFHMHSKIKTTVDIPHFSNKKSTLYRGMQIQTQSGI